MHSDTSRVYIYSGQWTNEVWHRLYIKPVAAPGGSLPVEKPQPTTVFCTAGGGLRGVEQLGAAHTGERCGGYGVPILHLSFLYTICLFVGVLLPGKIYGHNRIGTSL